MKRERCSDVLPILPGHEQQFLLSGVDAATSDPAEGMGTYYKRFTKTNEAERGAYMSIKIKVSYTDDQELAGVVRLLSPIVRSWKKQPAKGKYKRAYGESNREKGVHTK